MLEALFYTMTYAVLIVTDLIPVYREKNKTAVVFCTIVFASAFLLQMLVAAGVQLPSPTAIITNMVEGVFGKVR